MGKIVGIAIFCKGRIDYRVLYDSINRVRVVVMSRIQSSPTTQSID